MIMEEIGREGQERISKTKVAVVGAGGLGSSALFYIAGAGVHSILVPLSLFFLFYYFTSFNSYF